MYHHQSEYYSMRGSGIGSIFSNIFRGLLPLAKKLFSVGKAAAQSPAGRKILKAAKKTALDTGLDIAHDTLEGENVKTVAKRKIKGVGKTFLSNVQKEMKTGGKRKAPAGKGGACSKRPKLTGGQVKRKPMKGKPTKKKGGRTGGKGKGKKAGGAKGKAGKKKPGRKANNVLADFLGRV